MAEQRHTSRRIVIVGGGVAGLSIATRLAQAGLPVTVLEASRIGSGASTRNQGWLYSGAWFAPTQPRLARMCYESLKQTLQFGRDCLEPYHDSMAFIVSRPETLLEEWTEAWSNTGIPFEDIPADDLAERLPGFNVSAVRQAFQLPDHAIRVDRLLQRLAASAQNAGAEIRDTTSVRELLRVRETVQGVKTGHGEEITARLVILATGTAGLWLIPRAEQPASPSNSRYALVPLKSHLVAVQPEVSRWPFCVLDVHGFNHIPHVPTSVFGTTRWHLAETAEDQQADPQEIELIWHNVNRFFPDFDRDAHETTAWAGTTVQAMHVGKVEPGIAPLPTVIDHEAETPPVHNLLSVFPGRATLWAHLAEQTRKVVLEKLGTTTGTTTAQPPWGMLATSPETITKEAVGELYNVVLYHCQTCGSVKCVQAGLQPPTCCGREMAKAGEETVRPSD